ncbi:hypothetical protein BDA99DRAFT_511475 [Phascolomyces articulosus]|uniref:Bromo domain-containing protein n=1 Tax=Phascolomyces articulosus TaxID=60185 RepID=A0AAD5JZ36_9FUNG|nr:hypothetical protein BDA99DRAFT_511475 [Phascolomyces articulosus]
MEQELYYLIFRFLYEGPCQDAAYALAQELKKHRSLLPKSSILDGSGASGGEGGEPATLQQLSEAYPRIGGDYLPNLLRHLLHYFKMTQSLDTNQRARLYQHGDDNLFTLLSAFEVARANPTRYTYMSVPTRDLYHLSLHEMIQALEIGRKVTKPNEMPAAMSTFYRERVTMSGHRQHVYCLAFDKADARLFTGSDDFLVKVWNVRTGHLIYTIRGHQNVITDIAINEENTLIATASSDGYVRVWKMDTFEPVAHLKTHTSTQRKPFTTVKFSPSPKAETRYLMATNEDGLVRLWRWDKETLAFYDVESPIVFSCKFKASDRLRCSSFNYTGTHFCVAGDDGFVYVFSTIQSDNEGHVRTIQEGTSSQQPLSESRPRVGRGRPRVPSALFPDKTGAFEDQPVIPIAHLEGHFGSVTDLAYSHDGKKILSGSQDGTARIWIYDKITQTWDSTVLDINKDTLVAPIVTTTRQPNPAHDNDISGVENDAQELGTLIPPCSPLSTEDSTMDTLRQVPEVALNTIRTSNSLSLEPQQPMTEEDSEEENMPSKVSMITWSADDRVCIIATSQGDIKVYFAHTGKLACVLKGHEGEVFAVESHPSNPSIVLSAGYDGKVIIWDIKKQCAISCTTYPGRVFLDCKFSQNGHKYALTDEDGRCTLYSIDGDSDNYKMVNAWHRGQFFYSDFLPVSVRPDGSVVDEQSLRPLHEVERRPIHDQSGVEYPRQRKEGYGIDLPLQPDGFETRSKQRERTYEMEEEEFKNSKPIKMEAVDRSLLAKKRRNFVKNDEEDESETNIAEPQFIPTIPIPAVLLHDDSDDEDYNEEANGQAYSSEEDSDADMSDGYHHGEGAESDNNFEEDEDGPVTRSRAGRQRPEDMVRSHHRSRGTSSSSGGSGRGRGRGRGRRPGRGRPPLREQRVTRATRRRRYVMDDDDEEIPVHSDEDVDIMHASRSDDDDEVMGRSEDDEDGPVRPRRRRGRVQISYHESDVDDTPSESESDSQNDNDNDQEEEEEASGDQEGEEEEEQDALEAAASGSSETLLQPEIEEPDQPSLMDRKGKRRLRSSGRVTAESDEDFQGEASVRGRKRRALGRRKPEMMQSTATTIILPPGGRPTPRGKPRHLKDNEMQYYVPKSWLMSTERSVTKYHPQMNDRVAILTEGHQEYWEQSELKAYFDDRHGPVDTEEPVVFGQVIGINWQVGPPTYCRLKLRLRDLVNLSETLKNGADPLWATKHRDVTIDFSDEDGCPEFLVLWEQFLASMDILQSLRVGQRVDALYDITRYTGRIESLKSNMLWRRARLPVPWAYYHIIWDDQESSPEDLSPWEIVPTGEDFQDRFDVGSTLSDAETKRAQDIISWLMQNEDFGLYIHQVDYYQYRNYLSQIAYPICLDMIMKRLNNGFYRSKQAVIDDVELVRKNAQKYNHETSPANKQAVRMANFFKTRFTNIRMPLEISRGRRTRRLQQDESDEEYEQEEEEDEQSPSMDEAPAESDGNESEFVDDDDDY